MTEKKSTLPSSDISTTAFLLTAFTLIILWGTAYNFVTVGVRYMTPIWLVALRSILGMVLVVAYAIWRGHKLPPLSDIRWVWYVILSLTGMVLPFLLVAMGQLTVDSGVSAILVGAMPIITIILAHFFAGERLTWRKMLGFVIGFCGIVLLFLPDNFSLDLVSDWKAQILIIGAAFFYAVTTVAAKLAPETPASLGAAMMLVGAAVSSTLWAFISGPPPEITMMGGLMVIALGVGSTAVGTILYLYAVQHFGPSMVAKINYFPPVAAVVAGALFLDEAFTLRIAAAFVILLVGIIIARAEKVPAVLPENN